MLRLTQAPNIAIATIWADLLSEAGMAASVQRQYLGAAAGHLPPDQCLPEIWLEHEEHAVQARSLLQALQDLPQHRWLCAGCGAASRSNTRPGGLTAMRSAPPRALPARGSCRPPPRPATGPAEPWPCTPGAQPGMVGPCCA